MAALTPSTARTSLTLASRARRPIYSVMRPYWPKVTPPSILPRPTQVDAGLIVAP